MELKVWVEGIQRIVCGVTDTTTCQDVVYALAHATGKTGRFTLIERWRNSERLLAPQEHPLKILLKWGEYSSDVQFILQRTALEAKAETRPEGKEVQINQHGRSNQVISSGSQQISPKTSVPTDSSKLFANSPPVNNKDIKKSLTFSGGRSSHLVSQSENTNNEVGTIQGYSSHPGSPIQFPTHYVDHASNMLYASTRHHYPSQNSAFQKVSPPNLVRPPAPPPYELVRGHPPPPPLCMINKNSNIPNSNLRVQYRGGPSQTTLRAPPPQSNASIMRPQRELPPYRDPPPPPPPSHPALLKLSPPQVKGNHPPQSFPNQSPTKFEDCSPSSSNPEKFIGNYSAKGPDVYYHNHQLSEFLSEEKENSCHDHMSNQQQYFNSNNDKIPQNDFGSSYRVKKNKISQESIDPPSNHVNAQFSNKTNENKRTGPEPVISQNVNSECKNFDNKCSRSVNYSNIETNNNNNKIYKSESASKVKDGRVEKNIVKDMIRHLVKDNSKILPSSQGFLDRRSEEVIVDAQYKELVALVNQQRETITAQQIDLTKYEAEIAFAEGRCKEEETRLNFIQGEIQRLENYRHGSPDSKMSLEELESQFREAQKDEKLAQENLYSIKDNIAHYERQLNHLKSKIRMLEDTLQREEESQKNREESFEEEEQVAIMREIEKLNAAVEQASQQAQHAQDASRKLSEEMSEVEKRLVEKKKEIEALKQAMREANMEALAMTPPDEAKMQSPENWAGFAKNGTSRRMKGSPRQLETAVPTSKNPHGVWV